MSTLLLFLFRIMASSKQPSDKLSPKKVRSKWSKYCPWDAVVKWFCEAGGGSSPDEARLEHTPYPSQSH